MLIHTQSNHFIVSLLLLVFAFTLAARPLYAQEDERPTRVRFGMGGGVGLRQFAPSPTLQNYRTQILSYKGKPEKTGWCGCQYFVLNEKGEVQEIFFDEYNAEVYARLGIHSRNGNGWFFSAGYLFSRYSYAYENVPFQFKNYTLTVRNSDLESNGIVFGVSRFWDPSFYVRLSGIYYYRYTTGGFDKPVNSAYKLNFTENGNGFLVGLINNPTSNVALMPEVGLSSSKHLAELSISAVVPLDRYAMTELYSYYRNRLLVGEATASYSTMTFSINLRLGLTLFSGHSWTKKVRSHKRESSIKPSPTIVVKPDPHVHYNVSAPRPTGRFDQAVTKTPVQLRVNFDLEKAELLPESFADLDSLAQWMKENSVIEIRLEGHTDVIGADLVDTDGVNKNLKLSRQRVLAVKEYLTRRQVASYRVTLAGFGSTRPLRRNCPPPNYCPENRRVELIITKR